ncbi:MAG: endonuclease domain-containing protein [bacterium]
MSKSSPFTKKVWSLRQAGCTDPFLCRENLEKLWEYQNGTCALTGLPIVLKGKNCLSSAHIDHCHRTGLIRGFVFGLANSNYLAGLEYLEEKSILPFAPNHVREYLINPPAQAFFKTLYSRDSAA